MQALAGSKQPGIAGCRGNLELVNVATPRGVLSKESPGEVIPASRRPRPDRSSRPSRQPSPPRGSPGSEVERPDPAAPGAGLLLVLVAVLLDAILPSGRATGSAVGPAGPGGRVTSAASPVRTGTSSWRPVPYPLSVRLSETNSVGETSLPGETGSGREARPGRRREGRRLRWRAEWAVVRSASTRSGLRRIRTNRLRLLLVRDKRAGSILFEPARVNPA